MGFPYAEDLVKLKTSQIFAGFDIFPKYWVEKDILTNLEISKLYKSFIRVIAQILQTKKIILDSGIWFGKSISEIENALHPAIS